MLRLANDPSLKGTHLTSDKKKKLDQCPDLKTLNKFLSLWPWSRRTESYRNASVQLRYTRTCISLLSAEPFAVRRIGNKAHLTLTKAKRNDPDTDERMLSVCSTTIHFFFGMRRVDSHIMHAYLQNPSKSLWLVLAVGETCIRPPSARPSPAYFWRVPVSLFPRVRSPHRLPRISHDVCNHVCGQGLCQAGVTPTNPRHPPPGRFE